MVATRARDRRAWRSRRLGGFYSRAARDLPIIGARMMLSRRLRRVDRLGSSSLGGQVRYTVAARIVWAVLQVVVLVQLARRLDPTTFAFATSAMVVLYLIVALNGLGLDQLMILRRSRAATDDSLPALYRQRLKYTYTTATLGTVLTTCAYLVSENDLLLALMPAAVWLVTEPTVTIWNGVSIADGRAQALLPSYLWRRAVPVLLLLAPAQDEFEVILLWSSGMAIGGAFALLWARGRREPWCAQVWPWAGGAGDAREFGLAFWWQQVGAQLRDLDVVALSSVAPLVGGLYALPARLVRPLNIVTQAVGTAAYPELARRTSINRRQVGVGLLLSIIPVCVLSGLLALSAPLLPALLGPAYAAVVLPAQLLCIAGVLSGIATSLTFYLQSRTHQDAAFVGIATVVSGLVQILFVTAGGVLGGAVGAAVGAIVAHLLLAAYLLGYSVRARDVAVNPERSGEVEEHSPPS